MNNKEIEEMLAKLNRGEFCQTDCFGCCGDGKLDITCKVVVENLEKEILKHYQPKIPEDAVVLTREEYSDFLILKNNHEFIREKAKELQADNERLYKNIGKFKELTRKETAREIFELLKSKLFDLGNVVTEIDLEDILKEYLR